MTFASAGVDEFAWRPDGRALSFVAADGEPPRVGADRFRDSFIFTTEPITTRAALQPSHLFTVSLDDGTTTQLTFGSQSVSDGSWSADGKSIVFTLAPNAITNDQSYSRIAIVNVGSRRVRALTGRAAGEGGPIFSPDGSQIAYGYARGDTQVNLTQMYVTTPDGGPGTLLSAGIDRPIGDAVWSRDSQSLIVTAPDGLTNALYRLPLRGAPQRIDVGNLVPGIPRRRPARRTLPRWATRSPTMARSSFSRHPRRSRSSSSNAHRAAASRRSPMSTPGWPISPGRRRNV